MTLDPTFAGFDKRLAVLESAVNAQFEQLRADIARMIQALQEYTRDNSAKIHELQQKARELEISFAVKMDKYVGLDETIKELRSDAENRERRLTHMESVNKLVVGILVAVGMSIGTFVVSVFTGQIKVVFP